MIRYAILLLVFIPGFISYAQIEISEDSEAVKKEKKKEEKDRMNTEGETEAILYANWSSTQRTLTENAAPFGAPLGSRADEIPLSTWSFGLGVRSRVHEFFSWEGGIYFIRNGESYLFEEADTMFRYETTYTYIGMPLKALFTYGQKYRVYAGVGIVPQLFVGYKQEQEWRTPADHTDKNTIETRSGYNSFVLSGVANIGVQANLGKAISVFVMPEVRYQLTSSYEKQDDYVHKAIAIGFNMGLSYRL